MPNETHFEDILQVCIERLDAGDSLDTVLADYPAEAEQLRDLLQLSQLLGQVTYREDELSAPRQRVYERVHGGRKQKNIQRLPPVFTYAAAILATLLVGGGLLVAWFGFVDPPNEGYGIALDVTSDYVTPTPQLAASGIDDTSIELKGTDPGIRITLAPGEDDRSRIEDGITAGSVDEIPDTGGGGTGDLDIVATSVASMHPEDAATPDGTVVALSASNIVRRDGVEENNEELASTPLSPEDAEEGLTSNEFIEGTVLPTMAATTTAIPAMPSSTPAGTATPAPLGTVERGQFGNEQQQPPTPTQQLPDLVPLRAGIIDDNAEWDDYLIYRRNFLARYPDFPTDLDVTMRRHITVTDGDGLPISGATVRVYTENQLVTTLRTYTDGQALFYPNASAPARESMTFRVEVEKDGIQIERVIDLREGATWRFELTQWQRPEATQLDVVFLVDSTGSMSDEIFELQTNMIAIAGQVAEQAGDVNIRYALVTYRDEGDQYITQVTDFVPDVVEFQATLAALRANGGGDYPEALNQAFHETVNNLAWRDDDTVKLVFLIADAPPHFRDSFRYDIDMVEAAAQGVKVFPLASSGLDQLGEYIFRQIAQVTMGKFLFLTYETDPQTGAVDPETPGDDRPELEAGSDPAEYTVDQLDELVVQLILEELAAQDVAVNGP